ncbi:MAG: hypothetical protein JHC95_21425 [Solirubrobacteraceae bacterium]|nr:hypothetical protein [Solirubrobacteraceae bacterium]
MYRSRHLPPGVIREFDGLPCLSPARTILDLIPARSDRNARRLVRNALRVKALTGRDLHVAIALHARRPGIVRFRQYARDYAHLPIDRTKSDAEALGLAILDGAGIPIPLVNVKIHGEEADYVWPAARWIIELDGGQWHHPIDDAIKQAVWERAGWTVKRLPTDAVFNAPHRLLVVAPPLSVRSTRP